MNRHYQTSKLKNQFPGQRLAMLGASYVWRLNPYEVAKFSGEMFQVMAEAAQKYIYEKSLTEIKKEFQQAILNNQNPS